MMWSSDHWNVCTTIFATQSSPLPDWYFWYSTNFSFIIYFQFLSLFHVIEFDNLRNQLSTFFRLKIFEPFRASRLRLWYQNDKTWDIWQGKCSRHVCLKSVCECVPVSRFFPSVFLRKTVFCWNLNFCTHLWWTGKVILLRNEMASEITEYC